MRAPTVLRNPHPQPQPPTTTLSDSMTTLEATRKALDPVLDPRGTGNASVDLFERSFAPGGVLHCDAAAGPSTKDNNTLANLALSLHTYLEGSGKTPRALFATLGKVATSSPDAGGAGTPGKAGGGRRALVAPSPATQLPLDAFQVALTLLLPGPVPLAQSELPPPRTQRALELIVKYLDLDSNGALRVDDVVFGFQRLNRAWLISKFPSTARGYDLAVQLRAEMTHTNEADAVVSWFTRSISSTSRLREIKSSGSGAAVADASLCLTNIELQKVRCTTAVACSGPPDHTPSPPLHDSPQTHPN